MFTKNDYKLWLKNKNNIELNKQMIEYFPFLLPRNRWTGLVSESYDYSYNEMFGMCNGWLIAFGYEMLCELREALVMNNCLYDYIITDVKEKYGTLRWYDTDSTAEVRCVIRKYCSKSAEVCQICGEPASHMTQGWIGYFCKKCGCKLGAEPIPEDWWEDEEDES